MSRGYGQHCGLARALELVGGRWTLLIVRELLVGPQRYSELAHGLPGIPSNVLASRLRELEEAGLVERALQPRPANGVVYALTAYGRELEEPVVRLGMWGAKALGPPAPGTFPGRAALIVALRGTFDCDAPGVRDLRVEIRLEQVSVNVEVLERHLTFPEEPSRRGHTVLDTSPETFSELFAGSVDVDDAVAGGRLRVDGSVREARRFFRVFRLPAPTVGR